MGSEINQLRILKDKSHYDKIKSIFNKNANYITKKYIGRPVVGCCSQLYTQLKPTSYQDFFNKYLQCADESFNMEKLKGDEEKGRSLDALWAIANRYYENVTNQRLNVSVEECFDDLVNHIIIETFDGHIAENIVKDKINNYSKYKATSTHGDIDAEYGVDIIVTDENNEIKHCIQVKPISTFAGNNNPSLMKDRRNFFDKQKKLDEAIGRHIPIEYMVYNKNYHFLERNKRHRFNLNELCNTNGNVVGNLFKEKFVQL